MLEYAANLMAWLRISRYSTENGLMDEPYVQECCALPSTICLHFASFLRFAHTPAHLDQGDENLGFNIQPQRINMQPSGTYTFSSSVYFPPYAA